MQSSSLCSHKVCFKALFQNMSRVKVKSHLMAHDEVEEFHEDNLIEDDVKRLKS